MDFGNLMRGWGYEDLRSRACRSPVMDTGNEHENSQPEGLTVNCMPVLQLRETHKENWNWDGGQFESDTQRK